MLAFLYDLFIIRFLCVFDWLLNTATSLLLLLRTIRQHLPLLLVGLQCVHTMEKGCSSWSFFHFFLLVRACSWVCGCLWVCVCLTVCVSVCFLGLLLCSFVKLLECCCHFSSSFHPHPYFPIGCLSSVFLFLLCMVYWGSVWVCVWCVFVCVSVWGWLYWMLYLLIFGYFFEGAGFSLSTIFLPGIFLGNFKFW